MNHFQNIKSARSARDKSPHATHKVGAALFHDEKQLSAQHNFWPKSLAQHIGEDQKLGNASTTIHAEIAAILAAPKSDGATLYITDLPCPNCAKAMIVAGIKEIYIDAHAEQPPLGHKMKPYFDDLSLVFLTRAGIPVFKINDAVTPLNAPAPARAKPVQPSPINTDHDILHFINTHKTEEPFAACCARNKDGQRFFITARSEPSTGLNPEMIEKMHAVQSKYKTILKPINRMLMICARYGLKMEEKNIYSSQTPTAREFVNLIGAGHTSLIIGNSKKYRDEWALMALNQLKEHKIIELNIQQ